MNRIKICVLSLVMCICLSMFGAVNAQAYTDYQGVYKKNMNKSAVASGLHEIEIMFGEGGDDCRKHKVGKSGNGRIELHYRRLDDYLGFSYKRISKHKYLLYSFYNYDPMDGSYSNYSKKCKYILTMKRKKVIVKAKSKKRVPIKAGTYKLNEYF